MKEGYVVNFQSSIYLDAENVEDAASKVLDIINTAYYQGNDEAYFPDVDFTGIYLEDDAPEITFNLNV